MYRSGGSECQEKHMAIVGELCQALDSSTDNVKVAIKLAEEHMEDDIAAREEVLTHGENSLATLRNVHEDMKKTVALNIDLAHKNVNLELELNHARRDALVLRKEALIEKQAAFDLKIESARVKAAIE